ncbi:MAG: hypothetical protein A3H42_03350 [Deltaproteobacteria bacterium RIFCSPLOWO2_02_FULL_46_8]|nr:MAG: hypothetical protein A3H42_03350 [Deltaproteobacteria bacterium RIFCSPLOWO2_02_FULL_46_8]
MKSNIFLWLAWLTALMVPSVQAAPFMRPPAFLGGIPGKSQFQAIQMQRHQARTLLYKEALEELRKNPKAADVPECPAGGASVGVLCLAGAKVASPATLPSDMPAKQEPTPIVSDTKTPVVEPETKISKAEKPSIARRRLAVLFGINGYKDPIPELETPIADVEGIADTLKSRYGYETRILKNVGKAGIIEALNAVAAEATPEDSVLLFYAGHGYLMEDTNMGYWIPIDASVKTAAGWISNTDISKLLSAISARQLILVSDSCFSGSLTKEKKMTGVAPNSGNVLQRRSVLAFSSGGEEPVSDGGKEGHSIFAWSFINTLQSAKGIAPGYEIYRIVHGQVTKDFPQEPQYGAVISAGHAAGGEYIFDAVSP